MPGSHTVRIEIDVDVTITVGGVAQIVEVETPAQDHGDFALGVDVVLTLLMLEDTVTGGLQHGGVTCGVAVDVFEDDVTGGLQHGGVTCVTVDETFPKSVVECIELGCIPHVNVGVVVTFKVKLWPGGSSMYVLV